MPADVREWDVLRPPAVIKLRKRETNSGKRSRDLLPDKSSISQRCCGSVAPRPVSGVESWAAPCFGAAGTFITSRCGPSRYLSSWQISAPRVFPAGEPVLRKPVWRLLGYAQAKDRRIGAHINDGGGLQRIRPRNMFAFVSTSNPHQLLLCAQLSLWFER